ncbi:hypothetical protein U1Q18_045264 [Sarracenia purpurea var. burkii]
MSPSYFPLRWEITGDQWWFASPIDWAAANGHYDLVRELLHLDVNHLIKLTSLRRIRRLEIVWDDKKQFDDVSRCRSQVARRLFSEGETMMGKNSLIQAGYGGWLLYSAASSGDLAFVHELLEKNPLLVFGEGEYGVTDILYAAARSKNSEVFRLLFDFAVLPRFLAGDGRELGENVGDISSAYKWEMMNRAVHAAARGGNLKILKELLGDCCDVLAFRDTLGSTILHAAAGRGQAEVVNDLIASFDIINSTDHHGNTALHVAAYRGQLSVVEALILASPSSIYLRNTAGETLLHMAVSGFQSPSFRRLDRQIEFMKQLVCGQLFDTEGIINAKNNCGRTALHLAIIGDIHSELVEQLMSVHSIDVNNHDVNGMTPLDLLKQRPFSASSDIVTRQLVEAGGIFSCQDHTARRTIVSHSRMRSMGSPGTSFRISDTEIFLYTGIQNASDSVASSSTEQSQFDSTIQNHNASNSNYKKPDSSLSHAAQRLKRLLRWPRMKGRKAERLKKMVDGRSASNQLDVPRQSRSSSFSKLSVCSPSYLDKQKGVDIENDIAGPSCSNEITDDGTPDLVHKARFMSSSMD